MEFTKEEIEKLKACRRYSSRNINEYGALWFTNMGFGHSGFEKRDDGKIISYSSSPDSVDVDSGTFNGYIKDEYVYDNVDDFINEIISKQK